MWGAGSSRSRAHGQCVGQYQVRLVASRSKIPVFAALVALGVLEQVAFAGNTITRIDVTGNNTVDAEAIRAHVKLGKDDASTPVQVNEALKSLFATGLFSDVKIDRRGTTLL